VRQAVNALSVAALAGALVACGKVPTAPDQPTQTQPSPQPAPASVTITGISRNVGSTGGGASITIAGTGFTSFVTVTFGNTSVHAAVFDPRNPSSIFLETPPHSAEVVDVIVTNPTGQSDRLTGGYTYVSPDSFDLNGLWTGGTSDGTDRAMGFTIQNNNLISVSCFGGFDSQSSSLTLSAPSPVSNGAFALSGNDGVKITGRIVSAGEVVGTMTMGGCSNMAWRAGKPAAGGVASR
jgi:hypothetical protein